MSIASKVHTSRYAKSKQRKALLDKIDELMGLGLPYYLVSADELKYIKLNLHPHEKFAFLREEPTVNSSSIDENYLISNYSAWK